MRLAFTELYCTTQFSMHWLVLNIEVLIWIKQLSSIMDGVYCCCQLISVMSEWWQIWTKEICLIYTRRLRGGLNRIWCSGKHHFHNLLRHIKNYINRKKTKSFMGRRNCIALYYCNELLVFGLTCQTLTATYYVNPSMSDTEWEIERCQLYENLETLIRSWWALNMEAPLNGSARPVQTILLTKHETY